MEIGIFIPLILAILILLFAGICQHRTFREKENSYKTQIRKVESSFAADRRALIQNEKDLIGIINKFQGKEAKIRYRTSPPEFFPENAYWKALSLWLRREKRWCCEKCGIIFVERQHDLHVHHIFGKAYNSPQHLKVLCIACQADEKGHDFMKRDPAYTAFLYQIKLNILHKSVILRCILSQGMNSDE